MSRVRWQEPNLARAPFVNERPVRRLGLLLWTLFLIVAGIALWNSQSIRRATTTQIVELNRLHLETRSARERAATLQAELRSADLPAQNERTEFLNRRLAERAFSWSRLLETLTETMPRGVRLLRLSPESFTRERGRGTADLQSPATTRVALRISGEAEETEALLEFVDQLFQHPAFHRPNLSRESEKKDFKIQFELTVAYLPEVANELAGAATAGPIGAAAPASRTQAGPRTTLAGASMGRPAPGSSAPALPAAIPQADGAAGAPTGVERRAGAFGGRSVPAKGERFLARDGAGAMEEEKEAASVDGGAGAVDPMSKFAGGAADFRPGATTPRGSVPGATRPAAPAPGGAPRFPGNVVPTPLKPYASTTGGAQ